MQRILDLVKMVEDGAMDMDSLFHHARFFIYIFSSNLFDI
jgi:hypothetical protein